MSPGRIQMPNGAALLGRPKTLGTVTLALLENNDVAITHSDFEPLMVNLIVDKIKLGLAQQLGVSVQMKVPPPPAA